VDFSPFAIGSDGVELVVTSDTLGADRHTRPNAGKKLIT